MIHSVIHAVTADGLSRLGLWWLAAAIAVGCWWIGFAALAARATHRRPRRIERGRSA